MSKLIQIPGKISSLSTNHIKFENLRQPVSFDNGTQDLTYPYTWNPNETLTFTYTLTEDVNEVLIGEVYRYGDNTEPPSTNFSEFVLGSGTVNISDVNYVLLRRNGKQYRLFNEDPTDEFSNGLSISRVYGSVVASDEVLYGHSNTVTSHILHEDTVGKKIVLTGYNFNNNTVTVTYKSEELTPFTLNPFITMEPYKVTYDVVSRPSHLAVEETNSKIFMCGKTFTRSFNSGSIYVYDNTTSNAIPIELDNVPYNNIVTTNIEENNTVHGFSVTPNVLNSGEYFLSIICGSNNHDMILYDSSTNTWTNKNNTFLNNNTGGIYMSENFTNPMWGKKPLDTKHFSSTGNVHAILTCFEDINFKPKVLYSDSNMENWTTIFDETKLISSVNPNIYGPISTIPQNGQCISKSTYSKIIDENTMFSEFCSYTTNNSYIVPNTFTGYNSQFLIKTSDGGTTWTDVHQTNPEYAFSGTVRNYISDDGQTIYSMIFYRQKSGATGFTPSITFTYADDIVLFNFSVDGGTSWVYPSNGWKLISNQAFSKYFIITSSLQNSRSIQDQQVTHQTMIYPTSTGEIVAVFQDTNDKIIHYISKDNGETWITGYGQIYGNKNTVSPLQGDLSDTGSLKIGDNEFTAEPICADDSFAAFVGYSGYVTQIDSADGYTVSDYLFYSLGGGYGGYSTLYDTTKIKNYHVYIPTVNTSSKISKLKGYL